MKRTAEQWASHLESCGPRDDPFVDTDDAFHLAVLLRAMVAEREAAVIRHAGPTHAERYRDAYEARRRAEGVDGE